VERFQVAGFDRIDMPRWNDVAIYRADNAANGTTKSGQRTYPVRLGTRKPDWVTASSEAMLGAGGSEITHGSARRWVMT
jgi:hypothetical protein